MNGIWPDVTSSPADDARHLLASLLERDVERRQHSPAKALLLAEQAEQDVLGADLAVPERSGLVLGENDDLPGSFGEPFEQSRFFLPPRTPRNG